MSLCLTRTVRRDVHPPRPPAPRYGRWLTGATLVASILAALAVWPRENVALPGLTPGNGYQLQVGGGYTIDDFATRMR